MLLFVLAAAYGVSVRQYSNDVWISLASGRDILTHGRVPTTDPFSYTFADQPWFNQNWLSHLIYYWLYDRIAPGAVVVFKWAVCAGIFVLVLLAGRVRSRSWPAALIAASLVAIASRHFLMPRPVIIGLLSLAGIWAVLSWLIARGRPGPWWPAVFLLPWLMLWGCAHGSFIFGYGLIGLFVACWLLTRIIKPTARSASGKQVLAVAIAAFSALVLTAWLGPYGAENFTHPLKVVGSGTFRGIHEWRPAYIWSAFPPVWPFWTLVTLGTASLVAAWLTGRAGSRSSGKHILSPSGPSTNLFDLASVAVGLWMAFWARRFAPLFYIVAAPAVLTWLMLLIKPLSEQARMRWRGTLAGASWLAAAALLTVGLWQGHRDYVAPYSERPGFGLLARSVKQERMPLAMMEFLRRNDLRVNLLTRWVFTGPVMFHAPVAKVFIDGRSQQVYSEEHYKLFWDLWKPRPGAEAAALRTLDQSGTDAVLMMRVPQARVVAMALAGSEQWAQVLNTGQYDLFMRRRSAGFERLVKLERTGRAWWPGLPEADMSRGFLWGAMDEPHYDNVLQYCRSAVAGKAELGLICYWPITDTLIRLGRTQEAADYLVEQANKLSRQGAGIEEAVRQRLLAQIAWCRQKLIEHSEN